MVARPRNGEDEASFKEYQLSDLAQAGRQLKRLSFFLSHCGDAELVTLGNAVPGFPRSGRAGEA